MNELYKSKIIIVFAFLLIALTSCQNGSKAPSPNPPTDATKNHQQPVATTPTTPDHTPMGTVTAVRLADHKIGWVGGEGWIARTDDGGVNWSAQYKGSGTIHQLFALNAKEAWATLNEASSQSGSLGLLSSADGGQHWSLTGKVPNKGFLHFVSSREAFSGNARTTDGGKTWSMLAVPKNAAGDAYFHDKDNGWVVTRGNNTVRFERTVDGGKTWKIVMTRKTAAPINGTLIRSSGVNDAWVELIGDTGMTQTSYSLFHTLDGGRSWLTVIVKSTAGGGPAPGFPADYTGGPSIAGNSPGPLYVVNPTVAFIGGRCNACDKPNTIGWTKDGGKTLTNGNVALTGFGPAFIAFADPSYGWWITTDNTEPSILYTSVDGGKTWKKTHQFDKPKPTS
ncbi:hypothetical protein ACQCN2_02500 [Brevibacillus ginsengisoli]|uniref:hypothetical protein n=1 Tax=Brevibacillus ginsengisoli TaxID=363854 RepID=UPI003CFB4D7E